MRLENMLGPDSPYNLHLLINHLQGFNSNKTAHTYVQPGLNDISEEMDRLLFY